MPNRTARVATPAHWVPGVAPTERSNGSVYTMGLPGATVDIPLGDAIPLAAAGFVIQGLVGTTAQRPSYADSDWPEGNALGCQTGNGLLRYFDTTLAAWIFFDRAALVWRNEATGAGPV